jgi:hypothetical protein
VWNPFKRRKTDAAPPFEPSTEVTQERLVKWREELLKTAYAMRVLDKISSRYLFSGAIKSDNEVRKVLGPALCDQLMNQSAIWSTIGDIEYILSNRYAMRLSNPIDLHDRMLEELESEIARRDGKR